MTPRFVSTKANVSSDNIPDEACSNTVRVGITLLDNGSSEHGGGNKSAQGGNLQGELHCRGWCGGGWEEGREVEGGRGGGVLRDLNLRSKTTAQTLWPFISAIIVDFCCVLLHSG